jgi:hypothetical protein
MRSFIWHPDLLLQPADLDQLTMITQTLYFVDGSLDSVYDAVQEENQHLKGFEDTTSTCVSRKGGPVQWMPPTLIAIEHTSNNEPSPFNEFVTNLLEASSKRQLKSPEAVNVSFRSFFPFLFDLPILFENVTGEQIPHLISFVYHVGLACERCQPRNEIERLASLLGSLEVVRGKVREWLRWFRPIDDSVLYAMMFKHLVVACGKDQKIDLPMGLSEVPSMEVSRNLIDTLSSAELTNLFSRYTSGAKRIVHAPLFTLVWFPFIEPSDAKQRSMGDRSASVRLSGSPNASRWVRNRFSQLFIGSSASEDRRGFLRKDELTACERPRIPGPFSPWIQDCGADPFVSLVNLEDRNVFETYQMPQPFETFGAVPIGKNALFAAISKAAEGTSARPKEAARAAYAEIGSKTIASRIPGRGLSNLAVSGLKNYIRDILGIKSVEFSFRAVVDRIMAFQPRQRPEVRQRVKTAVRIAMKGIVAEALPDEGPWQAMTQHHFVLIIVVSRGQPARFQGTEQLADEIATIPAVLIKAIARFVARTIANPDAEAECGELRSWVTRYGAMVPSA